MSRTINDRGFPHFGHQSTRASRTAGIGEEDPKDSGRILEALESKSRFPPSVEGNTEAGDREREELRRNTVKISRITAG